MLTFPLIKKRQISQHIKNLLLVNSLVFLKIPLLFRSFFFKEFNITNKKWAFNMFNSLRFLRKPKHNMMLLYFRKFWNIICLGSKRKVT